MKKRLLSAILFLVMLLSVLSVAGLSVNASTNGKSADDAIAWCNSKVGQSIDTDGYPKDQPYQCVDLIKAYYSFLGNTSPGGNGKDYATNALPNGWTRTKGGKPQKGDILVYGAGPQNAYGHVAIYESDNYSFHQNYNGVPRVQRVNIKYNSSSLDPWGAYWGCIHPDFSTIPNLSVTGAKVSNVTTNTARFDFTINNPKQVSVPECGAQIRPQGGSWTTHTESIVSNHRTLASIPAWYTVGSGQEFNYTLQPGTTYEMRGYCKYNGTTYYSSNVTFTTTPPPAKDISLCTITISPTSYIYDGSAKTPSVTVKDGSTTLTNGTHYTVAYSNNTNVGTGTVTITGKGSYKGSVQKTFTITNMNVVLDKTNLTLLTNQSQKLNLSGVPSGATVVWTSSNPNVATVDSNGMVAAKTYGKATITATVTAGSQKVSKTCNVQTLFYDVPDESVSGFKQIYWAADNGITKGYNDGEYFGPTKECTRQEFAIFLWRTMGQPDPKGTNLPFSDVSGMTDAGKKAVSWAVKNGIIQGFEDKTFRPNSKVTREQIVIMLWRTAGKPAANKALPFTDTKSYSKTSTSYKAMSWASEKEIIYGFSDNTFRPKDNSKRNQVVIMLYRFVNQ